MHFSLALAESGNVYAWGWNSHGQLGLNDSADRGVPTRVPGLERVRAIAAGETHAAALTAGALIGWGSNATGQIGAAERMQLRPAPFFALV
jgi:alpha-tubulin suppressor-like RCC1 family protein